MRRLTVQHVLSSEEVRRIQAEPVFTTAQLHVLKQQIESLRRINLRLRAWKHRQRKGEDLPVAPRHQHAPTLVPASIPRFAPRRGRGRGRGRPPGGGKKTAGGGRGRGAKRAREDSPDLSLVDDGSEGEAEEEEESEEAEMSDYETPEESDEDEVAAKAVAGMPSPRRQSGRHRGTPRKVLKEASVSSGSGGGGSERSASSSEGGGDGSSEGEDGESGDESGDSVSRGGGNGRGRGRGRPGQHSPAKPKRVSFVVVKEEEDSTGGSIVLPKLAGVPVEWPTGDDALCTVCGDGEDADGNAVLLCEGHGCSVAVHQQCYGVSKVPKGKWLCDACKAKLSTAAPNCACCPVVGGAVRKVVSLGRVVPASRPAFVHVACTLWTPEITLAEPEAMRGVQLDAMTTLRAELQCALCKQAGGAVVQCSYQNCCRPFHVMCGRAAGQLLTFRLTDGEPLAFCGMHSKERFNRSREAIIDGVVLEPGAEEEEDEEGEEEAAQEAAPLTEYDRQRQQNIERNRQMLAAIRAQQA